MSITITQAVMCIIVGMFIGAIAVMVTACCMVGGDISRKVDDWTNEE